jgi:alpha-1,2-mannosyltransferase
MNEPPADARAVRPARAVTLVAWALGLLLLAASVVHFVVAARSIGASPPTDFPIFLSSVRRFVETGQLYESVDDLAKYRAGEAVYKYPPLYATTLLPWAHRPSLAAAHAHFLAQLVLYLGAAALLVRVLARDARSPGRFALLAAVVALTFGPFLETLQGLQIETAILALLAVGLLAIDRGQDALLGAALGAATVLKVYPGFLLLFLVAQRRWRAVVAFGVAAAALVGVGLLVFGVAENWKYFHDVLPTLLREAPVDAYENVSIARHLQSRLGLDPLAANRVAHWIELPMAATTLLALLRARRRDDLSPRERATRDALAFALCVTLMLVCMPNSWLNYQCLLLLPLFVLLRDGLEPRASAPVLVPTLFAGLLLVVSTATPLLQHLSKEREHQLFPLFDLRGAATLVLWAVALVLTVRGPLRRAASNGA